MTFPPATTPSRTYVIAELSANHSHSLDTAKKVIDEAKAAGADAIKLQTYTADLLTLASDKEDFVISGESLWAGRRLHDLYDEAHTPWDWHEELFRHAAELGLACFSTPFDPTAVDFLEQFEPPAYKIASFEIVDLPLIEYVASKGRPIIMSTGMATLSEIADAVDVVRQAGVGLTLLKCTSAYPSPPESMNLATIPHLGEAFQTPVGLSDHTLGIAVPVAAVALGARVIEKHFTLSRAEPGPDSAFSLEPHELRAMVDAIRVAERAIGQVHYGTTEQESSSRVFRRSLYAVRDIAKGETFTTENVRSIRPGYGLSPKHLPLVLGRKAACDLEAGTRITEGVF